MPKRVRNYPKIKKLRSSARSAPSQLLPLGMASFSGAEGGGIVGAGYSRSAKANFFQGFESSSGDVSGSPRSPQQFPSELKTPEGLQKCLPESAGRLPSLGESNGVIGDGVRLHFTFKISARGEGHFPFGSGVVSQESEPSGCMVYGLRMSPG